MSGDSFLTEQQIRILRLRAQGGLKQSEIAELLGTSRANVSILERRALRKIEKARNTLLLWEQINSRLSVEVRKGGRTSSAFPRDSSKGRTSSGGFTFPTAPPR